MLPDTRPRPGGGCHDHGRRAGRRAGSAGNRPNPVFDPLRPVFDRQQRGFFVAFGYTADALREIEAFFRKSAKAIIALTVRGILEEEIAGKLA